MKWDAMDEADETLHFTRCVCTTRGECQNKAGQANTLDTQEMIRKKGPRHMHILCVRDTSNSNQRFFVLHTSLLKRTKLLQPPLRPLHLSLQHPPPLLTPDLDNTFELLRSDIEPIRVRKDIVLPPLDRQNIVRP